MGVVVATVSSYFPVNEWRNFKGFVLRGQFHLGNHETNILAIKLVNLEDVTIGHIHEISGFVDNPRLTKLKELFSITERNLLLKLKSRHTVGRGSLDSKEQIGRAHV